MAQITSPATDNNHGQRPAGWRGGQQQEVARHQWQRVALNGRVVRGPWRTLQVAGLFAAAAGLSVLLLYYLLYAPARTPVLAVVASDYVWPLPPNSWAAEDLAALGDLHQQTLQITDISEAWRSRERGLAQLKSQLADLRARHPAWQPVVIYLSLHGAVDGDGKACLIPPGASPQDSSTWLPLADVLQTVKSAGLPARQPKLLVLDCNRRLVNWHAGVLVNTFAEALLGELNEAKVPGLVVLNSTSPGETGAAAAELRSSVFAHYLRLGLAGAADWWSSGGNANGRVTLHELVRYLARNVDGWVAHHQGMRQQPMIVPADARDFDVAVAMRTRSWRQLAQRAQRVEQAASPVAASRLHEHWATLDELREGQLWRFDPVAWRTLEQRLLWLEELSAAGSAYSNPAKALDEELGPALAGAKQRLAAARRQPSLPAYSGVLAAPPALPAGAAHSLPLVKFFGAASADRLQAVEGAWSVCEQAPSPLHLQTAVRAFEQAELAAVSTEGALLSIWQRHHVPTLWPNATTLSEILAVRRAAEQLAAPVPGSQSSGGLGDERAHMWLRPRLKRLDELCRKLEDAALLGPRGAEIDAWLAEARSEAQSASQAAVAMADAWARRDRLWAEVPYLAAWLTRPRFDADGVRSADTVIRQSLLPLFQDGLELERQLLRSDSPVGDELAWTADGAARKVQDGLAALQKHWSGELQRLQSASMTAASVAQIDAALAVPLLPADSRQRLRQKRIDIVTNLMASFHDNEVSAPTVSAAEGVRSYREAAGGWGAHPLILMLAAPGGEPSTKPDWPALGELVRQEMRTVALADLTDPQATVKSERVRASGLDKNRPAVALGGWCRAESRLRKASALWFDPPSSDPVGSLRIADLQQLWLASAHRALDDFYGPPRRGSQEPLFATAANGYLSAAAAIGPLSPAADAQWQQLRALLSDRRVAAQEALAVSANDILLADQATAVEGTIVVRKRPGESVAHLPAGELAVFLADEQGRIGDEAWPLSPLVSADGDVLLRAHTSLGSDRVAGRGPHLLAVATLRGNDFAAPVLLRAPGGTRVAFSRPEYGPPQVTLLGTDLKRASIVFVLDCSSSMRDPTTQEGPDSAFRPQTPRIDVAKGALRAMLEELADRGGARVGVYFFGHRVGWSTTEDNKLLRQTSWPDEIPAELRPSADVEAVLKLGRFDSAAAGQVSEKLAAAQPWGESPLYLAISRALGEFGPDDDAERTVVVITDGQNYQFNPPPAVQRSSQQVVEEARRAKASVFIVGFDIPAQESPAASREFQAIAGGTGGQFMPASGATAFLTTLEGLLRPGEFRVTAASGFTRQAELGRVVELPSASARQQYTASFEGLQMPLELFGGERVELAVSRGNRRLVVLPFQNPRSMPFLQSDGSRSSLLAGLHRPVRSKDGITFPLSIQDDGGRFVARPGELWVEIMPILEQAALTAPRSAPLDDPNPYIFYDVPYQPGTPVPFVRLEAFDWPAGASRASVTAWLRQSPVEPMERVSLAKVANIVPEMGSGYEVRGVTGMTYQARTLRDDGNHLVVGLVERHSAESAGVGSLKVTLWPPADHTVHQFDAKNHVVLHTFTYTAPAADLAQSLEVWFTSRDAILAGAQRLERPAEVSVSERSDLLELSSALLQ